MKKTFWASNFALKPKNFFRCPANAQCCMQCYVILDLVIMRPGWICYVMWCWVIELSWSHTYLCTNYSLYHDWFILVYQLLFVPWWVYSSLGSEIKSLWRHVPADLGHHRFVILSSDCLNCAALSSVGLSGTHRNGISITPQRCYNEINFLQNPLGFLFLKINCGL